MCCRAFPLHLGAARKRHFPVNLIFPFVLFPINFTFPFILFFRHSHLFRASFPLGF